MASEESPGIHPGLDDSRSAITQHSTVNIVDIVDIVELYVELSLLIGITSFLDYRPEETRRKAPSSIKYVDRFW